MARRSLPARIGVPTTAGGVLVVASSSATDSSPALRDAVWIAARIYQDPRDIA